MIAQHLGLSSQQVVTGELKKFLKTDDIPLKLMLLLNNAIVLSQRFHDQPMTQKEAVSFCESKQEVPAHLVEVDSQEENQAIHNEDERRNEMLKKCRGYKKKKTRYWMGIKKDPSGAGDWVRESNGKSTTFFNWKQKRDFACAFIFRFSDGTFWKDKVCDESGGSAYTVSALCEFD